MALLVASSAFVGAQVGTMAGAATGAAPAPSSDTAAIDSTQSPTAAPSGGSGAGSTPAPTAPTVESGQPVVVEATTVADAVVPSVVYIQVSNGSFNGQTRPVASGSGVIYDADGHIVTNRHVVATGSSYQVILSDGRTYDATLVGADPTTDLAVLKIEADEIVPITLGSTDGLRVGDPAVAVGSPLGLEGGPSLTVGVISATGREVQTDQTTTLFGMLQTDAAITEGSSGGALVDDQGHLIGITTAVGVSSVGIEGIGFATPVEIVRRVADELIATGQATQPILGITGTTAYTSLDDGGLMPTGVEVREVSPTSPATDAGLQPGDVITRVGGIPVDTMDELISLLRRYSAGDTVSLTVRQAGGVTTVNVTLADQS